MADSLLDDYEITFMPVLDPMYADVELFDQMFPEASATEIAELIYSFSVEALSVAQVTTTSIMLEEYVVAATACALSRIYDISGGADETDISLGDLKITKRSSIKGPVITRATATTWCELAAVLRAELYKLSSKSGMKAVVKGSRVTDEMPDRHLQRAEWRSF